MKNIHYINEFAKCQSDENMDHLIKLAKEDKLEDKDIYYLANVLASSGHILKLPKDIIAADIPSTGGPSSLSTLLCPLILREADFWVPKLGVRGRPAGGIDILYQIPGYRIKYQKDEVFQCLERNGYCHFIADENYTPADAAFFSYRSKVNATSVPSLVIASILAKKIAAGLKITGLDIRVSDKGNFGRTWTEAMNNGKRFRRIAKLANIEAVCILNNIDKVQQPYIGRGEALLALYQIFEDKPCYHLQKHFEKCVAMSLEVIGSNYLDFLNISEKIKSHFSANLLSQDANYDLFVRKAKTVRRNHTNKIVATRSGFLNIDLNKLKLAIIRIQDKFNSDKNRFSDPCGIIFKKLDNDLVKKGDTLLTFRCEPSSNDHFKNYIQDSIYISDRILPNLDYQVIV